MRVLHFVPAYRQQVCPQLVYDALAAAFHASNVGDEYAFQFVDLQPVARARNFAVKSALAQGFDLLLMQDADVFGQGYNAYELLRESLLANDAAAVGAAVKMRSVEQPQNCRPFFNGEVFDGVVGTGLMLIDLRKLRALPAPWFVYETSEDGAECVRGEDMYFCRLLEQHGHRVLVDARVPTTHWSGMPLQFTPRAAIDAARVAVDGRNRSIDGGGDGLDQSQRGDGAHTVGLRH